MVGWSTVWRLFGWGIVAVCVSANGVPQARKQPGTESDQAIKVAVEMVSLPVVVTTRDGKRVTDLQKEDFRIFENSVEQEIAGFSPTDEPVSVVLALDTSGSTEQKLAAIQNEAIEFVNQLHPDDSVAIMSFAGDVTLLEDFSIDRDRNAYGIKETRAGGWTVLYEAVWLALEEVLKPVKERKALVLFTDGVDTASRKASEKDTIEQAKETGATIYSIYFNTEDDLYTRRSGPTVGGIPIPGQPPILNPYPAPGRYPGGGYPMPGPGGSNWDYRRGRDYLQKLAEFSGGIVLDALQMQDLRPVFAQIARELGSQYSIGYYPTNLKRDRKFRKVEVKLKKPDLVARTKKGYYPASGT